MTYAVCSYESIDIPNEADSLTQVNNIATHNFGNLRNAMGGSQDCPLDSENPRVVYNCGRWNEAELPDWSCARCDDDMTELQFDTTSWDAFPLEEVCICYNERGDPSVGACTNPFELSLAEVCSSVPIVDAQKEFVFQIETRDESVFSFPSASTDYVAAPTGGCTQTFSLDITDDSQRLEEISID